MILAEIVDSGVSFGAVSVSDASDPEDRRAENNSLAKETAYQLAMARELDATWAEWWANTGSPDPLGHYARLLLAIKFVVRAQQPDGRRDEDRESIVLWKMIWHYGVEILRGTT